MNSQLKHLEPIRIIQFPSCNLSFLSILSSLSLHLDVDRARRLSETLRFLQIFDTEKDIAEINILFFLYMKYKGNIKQICQSLQCNTINNSTKKRKFFSTQFLYSY